MAKAQLKLLKKLNNELKKQSIIKYEFSVSIKVSQNTLDSIVEQIETASKIYINCLKDRSEFNAICDVNLLVNSHDTPRIQEVHILIGHTIFHLIDLELTYY